MNFRIDYASGFEIVEARDMLKCFELLRARYKRTGKMPISVTQVATKDMQAS
jgi:hypothetical protein